MRIGQAFYGTALKALGENPRLSFTYSISEIHIMGQGRGESSKVVGTLRYYKPDEDGDLEISDEVHGTSLHVLASDEILLITPFGDIEGKVENAREAYNVLQAIARRNHQRDSKEVRKSLTTRTRAVIAELFERWEVPRTGSKNVLVDPSAEQLEEILEPLELALERCRNLGGEKYR